MKVECSSKPPLRWEGALVVITAACIVVVCGWFVTVVGVARCFRFHTQVLVVNECFQFMRREEATVQNLNVIKWSLDVKLSSYCFWFYALRVPSMCVTIVALLAG